MTELSVAVAGPEHASALEELFERADCACFCRWWHFPGDKNDWLARVAHAPEQNRAEMLASFGERPLEMSGVVALAGGRAAGWMKLAPAETLAKLFAQKPYRGLGCFGGDRARIWVVGCFLVEPGARRTGVARELLAGGLELARARGARAVEAFPRRAEPVSAELLWTGPAVLFEEAGFQVVDDSSPYPVLRKVL
jgi:GNAT superfamily N-acetyltransferase